MKKVSFFAVIAFLSFFIVSVVMANESNPFGSPGMGMADVTTNQWQTKSVTDFDGHDYMVNYEKGTQVTDTNGWAYNGQAASNMSQSTYTEHVNGYNTWDGGKMIQGTENSFQMAGGNVNGFGNYGVGMLQKESGSTVLASFGTGMSSDINGSSFQNIEGRTCGGYAYTEQNMNRQESYGQFKYTQNGMSEQWGNLYQTASQGGSAARSGAFTTNAYQAATGSTNTFYASGFGTNMAVGNMGTQLFSAVNANFYGNAGAGAMAAQNINTGYHSISTSPNSVIVQNANASASTYVRAGIPRQY